MTLLFATNNPHKAQEIKAVVPSAINIITMKEAGIDIDIPEPHDTLELNAAEKARTLHTLTNSHCFSEDTGLHVTALQGEPGVRSARYAGEKATSAENINKLLYHLQGVSDRSAYFKTVVFLIINGEEHTFEGVCEGTILTHPKGNKGFGYDAVFLPAGAHQTFAEMSMEEKNTYSHRKKAIAKLVTFLNELNQNTPS